MFFNKKDNLVYVGRNGTGNCLGLAILDDGQERFALYPVNSKGNLAHCLIQIPARSIADICMAVPNSPLSLVLDRIEQAGQLPLLIGLSPELDQIISLRLKKG